MSDISMYLIKIGRSMIKMKLRTVFIILISVLMIGSIFASAVNVNKTMIKTNRKVSSSVTSCSNMNSAEVPIWHVGDSWTYHAEVKGGMHVPEVVDIDFDIAIDNLKFEVAQVQNDKYILEVKVPKGKITGYGGVDFELLPFPIEGTLKDAKMDGTLYVDKSTLGFLTTEDEMAFVGSVSGKVGNIPLNIDVSGGFAVLEDEEWLSFIFSPLKFPLNVGDSWMVPESYPDVALFLMVDAGLIPEQTVGMQIIQHTLRCTGEESVTVDAGTYDALKISNSSDCNFWYSEETGNIIKVDYRDVEFLGWNWVLNTLEMTLIDTTYNTPPDAPERPTGPTDGRPGEYTYCTSGIDLYGDQVQYGFDWGDGTSITWTDLVDSGEQACAIHKYSSGGIFKIKAKTRDDPNGDGNPSDGDESGWSDELTVTIVNNQPNKPTTPSGPTSGDVDQPYTCETSATDPDEDRIKYGWDLYGDGTVDKWDDNNGNYYVSGEICSTPLKWMKGGTFDLKVIAEDEYGASSEWSESLTVTIRNDPPNKPDPPTGPTSGKAGTEYTYSTTTTDPEGHRIKYWFDWDDGTNSGWIGPFDSGTNSEASHTWNEKGDYNIRVKAKDEYNSKESDWSDPLPVAMPINKNIIKHEKIFDLLQKLFPSLKLNKLEVFY